MVTPNKFLQLIESKSKDLVPLINGTPLHSLHNPRREAEVFASNHLAHLSRTPNVLVLGLGFGYHIEEMIKILKLRHKSFNITVLEAHKELVTLWRSYQKSNSNINVYSATDVNEIYSNESICRLLLDKPVVIVHQPSFEVAKTFYKSILEKRSSPQLSSYIVGDPWWDQWASDQTCTALEATLGQLPQSKWLKAYWEIKHAD